MQKTENQSQVGNGGFKPKTLLVEDVAVRVGVYLLSSCIPILIFPETRPPAICISLIGAGFLILSKKKILSLPKEIALRWALGGVLFGGSF